MFQCATEDVTILLQRARQQGPDEVGPDEVREIYGIDPAQVPDFIALRGDPSDGLPGAKGIGAKTAADLLQRKGDLEHVILGAIREKPSVRKALIEQAAELRMFRDIATLRSVAARAPGRRARPIAPAARRPPRRSGWGGSRSACQGVTRLGFGSARTSRSKAVSPTQWAAADGDRRRRRPRSRRCAARSAARRGRSPAAARAARRPPSGRARRRRAGRRPAAAPGRRRCPAAR